MRKHHQLQVWQEAMALVKMIYTATATFPQSENYGLTSQMRRASVSIPSNVAEGAARTGTKEFLQFLSISRGSLSELETQVLIAKNLGYIKDESEMLKQIDKLFGLIGGLMNSLRKRSTK
ncbi:MAG: four helix bundle protein [Thermodesulfobacteriota bacterium]|nr:four helix bundle protein [Thermodesulfobacteriota bacterium]